MIGEKQLDLFVKASMHGAIDRDPWVPPRFGRQAGLSRVEARQFLPRQLTRETPMPQKSKSKSNPATKKDRVLALLERPKGATIAELTGATGWRTHSVRGFLSGTVKRTLGLSIQSTIEEGRGRVYRIAAGA